MRELEELILNQIASYRMNVEGELLSGLISESTSHAQLFPIELSDAAMRRLQNNVSSIGIVGCAC